eukprot:TRINITY_DN9480_c0_g1_i1.p1 TRINITY_DN9480_c0_g1~~TRINITY_DN9480_c0_g1_i1.p1  ORF type:complete len:291 (-),score=59.58 TRINITY_DN9480_c0_g1_i1:6-878(-)
MEIWLTREPIFYVEGITSVFKRFFSEYCQLQILFTRNTGDEIVQKYQAASSNSKSLRPVFWSDGAMRTPEKENVAFAPWQQDAIPWAKLKEIVNVILEKEYDTVESLQEDIQRKRTKAEIFDFDIFDVKIYKADTNTKILTPTNGLSRIAVATLSGDASVTAHYRLGVGINNAFRGLPELGHMIRELGRLGPDSLAAGPTKVAQDVVEAKEKAAKERADSMVQFELTTMYLEAYCSFVVFYDLRQQNYWSNPTVYQIRKRNKSYDKMSPRQMIQKCSDLAHRLNVMEGGK